jgi:hypothetical protein
MYGRQAILDYSDFWLYGKSVTFWFLHRVLNRWEGGRLLVKDEAATDEGYQGRRFVVL